MCQSSIAGSYLEGLAHAFSFFCLLFIQPFRKHFLRTCWQQVVSPILHTPHPSADLSCASGMVLLGVHWPTVEGASSSSDSRQIAWWDFQSAIWHFLEQYCASRQRPQFLAGTKVRQTTQPGFALTRCGI